MKLDGVDYLPLRLLCQSLQYDCEWERFRGTATVRGDHREVECLVGSAAILVDGRPGELPEVVRWYDGAVMVPRSFEQLFARSAPRAETVPAVTHHAIRRILIDPGHGGKDPGALGRAGLREKTVVLDIAREVAQQLRNAGFQVNLTRSGDTFVPLSERAALANRGDTDLFIAIHANANRNPKVHGIEVYYLTPKSLTLEMERSARQAREATLPYDHTALNTSLDTKAIVWDLLNVEHRRQAIELGRVIAAQVARELGVRNGGVKGARFHVLRETDMPAVLVEVGYVTNPAEGARLADAAYRAQLAQAVTQGILDYARTHDRTDGFSR